MKDSDWYDKDKLPSNTAIGYTYEDAGRDTQNDHRTSNHRTLPGKGSSAGGGYSTLHDLLAFVKSMRQGVITTPDFQPDGL